MPSALRALRAEWDDHKAQRYLEKRGYVMVTGFQWLAPKRGHKPTAKEGRALDYLVDEWDWGGVVPHPPFDARQCLAYDPFAGDEADVRVLSDKIITTRASRHLRNCSNCLGWIPPKCHPVRARTEINREERKVMTFYFCPVCCEAMAIVQLDAGISLERRVGKLKWRSVV